MRRAKLLLKASLRVLAAGLTYVRRFIHSFHSSGERLLWGVASGRNWSVGRELPRGRHGEMLIRMAWQAKTWLHIGAFLPVFKRGPGVLRSLV
jgi:hypothetical protein